MVPVRASAHELRMSDWKTTAATAHTTHRPWAPAPNRTPAVITTSAATNQASPPAWPMGSVSAGTWTQPLDRPEQVDQPVHDDDGITDHRTARLMGPAPRS